MRATYDPLADAVSITFKKGRVAKTKEISNGVLIDVDQNDTPLYLEILDASKRYKKNKKDFGHIDFVPFKYTKQNINSLLALAK